MADFGRFPAKAARHPLKPPFVTPPFAAAQEPFYFLETALGVHPGKELSGPISRDIAILSCDTPYCAIVFKGVY